MPSIADNLTSPAHLAGTTNTDRPCRLGAVLAGLDDTDRTAVVDALTARDPNGRRATSDDRIAAVLTRAGHGVGHSTIGRHRRGHCNCSTTNGSEHSA